MWQRRVFGPCIAFGVLPFTACDNPVSPCDAPHACEVDGVDLEMVSVNVLATDSNIDPVTGRRIISPQGGAARVQYVVRNRGNTTSPAATVIVHFDFAPDTSLLPALAPGATFTDTVTLFTRPWLAVSPDIAPDAVRRADLSVPSAIIISDSVDATPQNDSAAADSVHLAVPIVTGTILHVSRTDISVDQPFDLTFTLRNVSLHGATLPNLDLTVCLWDFDLGCYFGWWTRSVSMRSVPLNAGTSWTTTWNARITPTATWQAYAQNYSIAICVLDGDDPYIDMFRTTCLHVPDWPRNLRVRPDYEFCNPPVLLPATPVTLAAFNCGLRPATTRPVLTANPPTSQRFLLFAIDVVAGTPYRVQRAGAGGPNGLFVYDARGEAVMTISGADSVVSFPATGRYYIVSYAFPPMTVTATPN